ncbi:unnamed protein product [Trichobilharzia regenti]|nr:unnamed protein product [Trichobilharzia regenti]
MVTSSGIQGNEHLVLFGSRQLVGVAAFLVAQEAVSLVAKLPRDCQPKELKTTMDIVHNLSITLSNSNGNNNNNNNNNNNYTT